jgi:adenylate cyclase
MTPSKSNVEIERKFLVAGDAWREGVDGVRYRQGYLAASDAANVRVRSGGGRGFLTVKGARAGVTRAEFEYEIPVADADAMIETLCGTWVLEKTRYRVPYGNHVWDVDEFHGPNASLVIAEIELNHEDESFPVPPWIGEEVSHDDRYANAYLAAHPWTRWPR